MSGIQQMLMAGGQGGVDFISNGSAVDFDCSSFSSPTVWSDDDNGNGVSSILASNFDLDGGATYAEFNAAQRSSDVTSFSGDRHVISFVVNPASLISGAEVPNNKGQLFLAYWLNSTHRLYMGLGADSFWVLSTASGWSKVADIDSPIGIDSTITLDVTGVTGGTPIADIWINDVELATGQDVDSNSSGTAGLISLAQYSRENPSYTRRRSTIKRILIGDGLA